MSVFSCNPRKKQRLAEPLEEVPRGRNPGLLKLFFAGYLDGEVALRQLRSQLVLHRRQLERYEETRGTIAGVVEQHPHLERAATFWELVRDLGERNERMYVEWLGDAIRTMEDAQ